MSANNQILVKKYKDRWYVFNNIMAESWSDKNELSIKSAEKDFATEGEALKYAFDLDDIPDEFFGMPNSEYGVHRKLAKDGADVTIIE